MSKVYSLDEIKSIACKIAAKHGVERMFLFGSYARGDAKHHSNFEF